MKRFAKIFLIALLAFVLANVVSLLVRSTTTLHPDSRRTLRVSWLISDRIVLASGSIDYYPAGPFQHYSNAALGADIAIALAGSALVGSVYIRLQPSGDLRNLTLKKPSSCLH